MKYIDAEKLKAEIERQKKAEGWCEVWKDTADVYYARGFRFAYDNLLSLIDSLQQEQDTIVINKKDWEAQEQFRKNKDFGKPLQQEQPEVNFEKEWCEFEDWMESYITSDYPTYYAPKEIARHFYELGLNARKEK